MEIGDRVFHKGLQGNGIVAALRDSNQFRDTVGIKFFMPEEKGNCHNLDGEIEENAGLWCDERNIIPTPKPPLNGRRISIFSGRGIGNRLRLVSEIPRRMPRDRSSIIVNYGCVRHRVPRRDRFGNILMLNREINSNKYFQCRRFSEYGVPVPATSTEWFPNCIFKPNYSIHGRDIVEVPDENSPIPSRVGYFQEKINKVREFRTHVFLWGEEKVPYIQEKQMPDSNRLCWNKHQGGQFSIVYSNILGPPENMSEELFNKVCSAGIGAVRSISHDFGGVDIVMDEEENVYVLEVNSRCGLKERSLSNYKRKLWELYDINIEEYKWARWRF